MAWAVTLAAPALAQAAVDARGVYVPQRNGSLVALDPASGKTLWTAVARTQVRPAADGERVFVGAEDVLDAISSRSGERVWRTPLPARPAADVVTSRDLVFVALASGDLVAIDATSGSVRWQAPLGGAPSVTPVTSGETVVVGLADGQVLAVEVSSGRVLWRQNVPERVSALGADRDRVFVGSLDNFLYALAADDGRIQWRWRTGGDVIGAPVGDIGRVYFVSLDNLARALDREHGAQRWKLALTSRPLGGPLLVAGDLIVSLVSAEVQVAGARDGRAHEPVPIGGEPFAGAVSLADPTTPGGAAFVVITRDGRVQRVTRGEAAPSSSAPPPPSPPPAAPP